MFDSDYILFELLFKKLHAGNIIFYGGYSIVKYATIV
jgi:hypothetical protein